MSGSGASGNKFRMSVCIILRLIFVASSSEFI
ncbi:unnamed protein product [Kuraishia capsulata CBS 1993]|uniref:Uncharacterized protein n=1 Tax=Kuraishia capsulata CBS 1993 TaxID=1382522 RepID=W6MNH2_9ASCO|nr:uncharacterized protein KUCA_T00003807001 [Kuraishia capsulata CBS 1993]CDK27828.1 unnamed protein product [Kuraishia capsulata CBS 1993]